MLKNYLHIYLNKFDKSNNILTKIKHYWIELVGNETAQDVFPYKYTNKILFLGANNNAIIQEILQNEIFLLDKLNSEIGADLFCKLHLKILDANIIQIPKYDLKNFPLPNISKIGSLKMPEDSSIQKAYSAYTRYVQENTLK